MGKSEYFEIRKIEGEVEQPQIIIDASLTNQNIRKMTRQEIEDRKNALASVILDREAKLKEHDYVSAKIADGRATTEEYSDVIALKNVWAKEINEARAEIANLDKIIPEDVE